MLNHNQKAHYDHYYDYKCVWDIFKETCSDMTIISQTAQRRVAQILIITYRHKQLVTSLFLTPSLFPAPSLHTFTPSVLPYPATSISPLIFFLPLPPHAPPSLLTTSPVNSDHVWCFISSLHFSLLLRLMGCWAINEQDLDWTHSHTNPHIHMDIHKHLSY